ncbi:MAG: PAS domain S-box protein [Syntrophobacteraceae bacterium]|jgi:PAS domain S-box-containing protein|nr:PAS domain S-box protein [Syntrophobacteraceae bacterium]
MYKGIRPRLATLIVGWLLLYTVVWGGAAGADTPPAAHRVLILNSYHPGFVISDDEVAGLKSVLSENVEIFLEYMDASRMGGSQAFLELFIRQVKLKYGDRRFDAVVTLDDSAFALIRSHGSEIFPHVPVVFCGVSVLKDDMIEPGSAITGVLDAVDVKDTLLLGLKLHREARRVLVVTDRTTTGQLNRAALEALSRNGEIPAELDFLDLGAGLSAAGLLERLKAAPRDSIVYYADFHQDRNGEPVDPRRMFREVSRHSTVPVYVHAGMYVGLGAVGGRVTGGFDQGQAAGRLVARILAGEAASSIPIQNGPLGRYVFDHRELKRWSVRMAALPPDSDILHLERSFFETHRGIIWAALVFLLIQSTLIAYLLNNVSRLRRARYDLLESEERLRTIYEAANRVAFVMTDGQNPDGRITEFSLGAERMFGHTRDEMLGRPLSVLYPPETEADPSGRRPIFCEDDVGVGIESILARKDGQHFFAMTSAYPVHNEKTQQTGALFVTFDITELRQAREAVRESEEKYRQVVEGANDAIFIVQDGVIKFPNPMVMTILGYSAQELLRIPFEEHVHAEDRALVIERHQSRIRGESVPQNYSFRVIDRRGQLLWVQINAVRIQWEDRPATLCFLRDITSQKHLESQLLHAQKMQAVGTLAGGIAHDFNNLLQAILGNADMLLLKVSDPERVQRGGQQIARAARRGSDLTRQLLTFSRKIESKTETLDLNQVLVRLRGLLERTIPKTVAVDLRLEENLWKINADPGQVDQVLMNLALNSRDAMPEGGTLTIETRNVIFDEEVQKTLPEVRLGRYVLLRLSDTGHGMDQDTVARVFDPFFTTKGTGRGTGLGLAMAYGIVKNHGGYISCWSELGKGTCFEIHLPASDIEETTHEAIPRMEPTGGQETILLVDDEEVIREVGSDMLAQYGYRVLTAPDGETALEMYAREKEGIDLILMDLSMPGMGGRQCLMDLLRMSPDARVVIASGYSFEGPLKEVMELGARSVILKPYNSSELLAVIRQALR